MRNFFKKAKNTIIGAATFVKAKVCSFAARFRMRTAQARFILAESRGENFVDSGIKSVMSSCRPW